MTTNLYINSAMLNADGDTNLPILLDPGDAAAADLINNSVKYLDDKLEGVVWYGVGLNNSSYYGSSNESCGSTVYLHDDGTCWGSGQSQAAMNMYINEELPNMKGIKRLLPGNRQLVAGLTFDDNITVAGLCGAYNTMFRNWADVTADKVMFTDAHVVGIKSDGSLVGHDSLVYTGMSRTLGNLTNVKKIVRSYDSYYGSGVEYVLLNNGDVYYRFAREWTNSKIFTDCADIVTTQAGMMGLTNSGTVVAHKSSIANKITKAGESNVKKIFCYDDYAGLVVHNNNTITCYSTDTTTPASYIAANAWTGIVDAYLLDMYYVLGIKADGSVLLESSSGGQLEAAQLTAIRAWTNIKKVVAVSYGGNGDKYAVIGLKNDGTLVQATHSGWMGVNNIATWASAQTGILDLAPVYNSSADVIACKGNGQFSLFRFSETGYYTADSILEGFAVREWSNLKTVPAWSSYNFIGVKKDGTIVAKYRFTPGNGAAFVPLSGMLSITDAVNAVTTFGKGYYSVMVQRATGAVALYGDVVADVTTVNNAAGNIKKIAGGGDFFLVLKDTGVCYALGSNNKYSQLDMTNFTNVIDIATGSEASYGLKADGTVIAVGRDQNNEVAGVASWTNIVTIKVNDALECVGLKSDGTVVSTRSGTTVASWTNVVAIALFPLRLIGLRADGTFYLEKQVTDYTADPYAEYLYNTVNYPYVDDFYAFSASNFAMHTINGWYGGYNPILAGFPAGAVKKVEQYRGNCLVIIKPDGTCAAGGYNGSNYISGVSSWTDIVQATLTSDGTDERNAIGLKSDGTCVGTGSNANGETNVSGWTGIKKVTSTRSATIGLKTDGSCVVAGAAGDVATAVAAWTGLVDIVAGFNYAIGLKQDGALLKAGTAVTQTPAGNGYVKLYRGYMGCIAQKSDHTLQYFGYDQTSSFNFANWGKVIDVVITNKTVVGLRENGTVVATGSNDNNQLNGISDWRDIKRIAACENAIFGLSSSGDFYVTGTAISRMVAVSPSKAYTGAYPLAVAAEDTNVTFSYKTSGATIPYKMRVVRRADGTKQMLLELGLNKTTLGSDRYIKCDYGAANNKAVSTLPGTRVDRTGVSAAASKLGASFTDIFYGRDIVFRRSDGRVIDHTREVTLTGGSVTQIDFKLDVPPDAVTDVVLCYGASVVDGVSVPAILSGATIAAAESNPTPGVFWDYVPPAVYNVIGSDGLKFSDLPIRSFDYVVSDKLVTADSDYPSLEMGGFVQKIRLDSSMPLAARIQLPMRLATDDSDTMNVLNKSSDKVG